MHGEEKEQEREKKAEPSDMEKTKTIERRETGFVGGERKRLGGEREMRGGGREEGAF